MIFPFTLKGFPHKSSVLYSSFLYLFSHTGTIHMYGYYSYIWYYSRIHVLFIRHQQTLLESSVGANRSRSFKHPSLLYPNHQYDGIEHVELTQKPQKGRDFSGLCKRRAVESTQRFFIICYWSTLVVRKLLYILNKDIKPSKCYRKGRILHSYCCIGCQKHLPEEKGIFKSTFTLKHA